MWQYDNVAFLQNLWLAGLPLIHTHIRTYCSIHTHMYILYHTHTYVHTVPYTHTRTYCTIHTHTYILYNTHTYVHTVPYTHIRTYCTIHTHTYILYHTQLVGDVSSLIVALYVYCMCQNSLLNKLDLCMKEVLWLTWQVMSTSGRVPSCSLLLLWTLWSFLQVSHCLLCWLPYFWGAFRGGGAFALPSHPIFSCIRNCTCVNGLHWEGVMYIPGVQLGGQRGSWKFIKP